MWEKTSDLQKMEWVEVVFTRRSLHAPCLCKPGPAWSSTCYFTVYRDCTHA